MTTPKHDDDVEGYVGERATAEQGDREPTAGADEQGISNRPGDEDEDEFDDNEDEDSEDEEEDSEPDE